MTSRLLLSYLALTALVLSLLVVPLGVVNARTERRELQSKVERDAQAVASLAEDALERGDGRAPAAVATLARRYLADTGGRIVVVDRGGRSLVDADAPAGRDFSSRPEIRSALAGRIAVGTRHSATLGTGLLYVSVPVASGGVVHGAARVTYPTSELDRRVRRYWLLLAAVAAVALGLAAALGAWLARWASRPVRDIERAAVAVGAGDLTARAPVEGPPETRALARSFNETVAKLDTLLTSQQEFVADASHQLRTPLTALRLRLEGLERSAGPGAEADVSAAQAEVARLAELVDALLALARADEGLAPAGTVDVAALARERVDAWSALADERGVRLEGPRLPALPAHAARERVEQVLDNLLANAIEASPPGGVVRVGVAAAGAVAELRVVDGGSGLTPEERARAFDRFWRKGPGEGTGLGLAIARRLVEADGGGIELAEAAGGGLEAVVRLQRP